MSVWGETFSPTTSLLGHRTRIESAGNRFLVWKCPISSPLRLGIADRLIPLFQFAQASLAVRFDGSDRGHEEDSARDSVEGKLKYKSALIINDNRHFQCLASAK